ncbi:DNA glycosylase AlkZ-like family protein [Euzebya pacifica]|uniref:DNA glycosylase AlkZ-like family protein n=1 Tax=Euzebya pacifica TaxID=1608957 RepID=UPI0030F9285F
MPSSPTPAAASPRGAAGRWAALDDHHLRGDLAIAWRDDRMTAYFDLPERVIPSVWLDAPVPAPEEAERALLLRALEAVGVGTAADLADHHRQHVPTARRHLAALAAAGLVEQVDVEGWRGPVYAVPGLVVPRGIGAATLLNPFDPVMWNRPRVARMFDLDYTVEIYVPADKRRWGYYVLPFLLGDRLVALVDLKHDRKVGVLRVAAAHLLPGADADTVVPPLVDELHTWATWVGADEVEVVRRGDLATALSSRV